MAKYQYGVKKATDMSKDEFVKCARLFSESYGKYSKESSRKPGEQVMMSERFFEERYKKEGVYIATCKHASNGTLVGQAIYVRKQYSGLGTMTWVMQLVVSNHHRNQGIGSKLLHSIWGFSDDFAWGLATANPCTVKALERATFRKCDPVIIKKNLSYIKKLAADISFVIDDKYDVTDECSQAFTDFFIDNSEFTKDINEKNWKLGRLKPGYEWLAFTFKTQDVNQKLFERHFAEMLTFSEEKLKDAYGRMKMSEHSWAKGAEQEISEIINTLKLPERSVFLDVGCGRGRHSIELARRGFHVDGIDFVSRNIRSAKSKLKGKSYAKNCHFFTCDAKEYQAKEVYDCVLCLYDVIGSYPEKESNIQIIEGLYNSLSDGGYAVISVMNLDYVKDKIQNLMKGNIAEDYSRLYHLKPSRTMQKTGDIFDTKYMILDEKTGVIYRKEQFDEDYALPAEYLIRDKRFQSDEIQKIMQSVGFEVLDTRFVRAGNFGSGQKSEDCKEILVIARK